MPHLLARLLSCCAALLLALGAVAGESDGDAVSGYQLGAGDRIQVYVFDEPELSLEYTLSDAGTISYPFLGEIRVKGLTIGQLEERITRGLKGPYLVDPRVNVTVREYRQFFILGEVNTSGGYAFRPGLTLRKAISVAGGLSADASEKKIFVIREDDPARAKQPIGMDDSVYAGDTVMVEKGFF
jgi:protein involved in polysaccharide export with SLBB domain